MYQEEKTFRLRVTLEASFPDNYDGEEDESNWIREWEARMKPQLIKSVFDSSGNREVGRHIFGTEGSRQPMRSRLS